MTFFVRFYFGFKIKYQTKEMIERACKYAQCTQNSLIQMHITPIAIA